MKSFVVSLTVWSVQVLSLYALHGNHTDLLLTTDKLDVATTTANITTTKSADELMPDGTAPRNPTLELSSFTSSLEDVKRNSSISTADHIIMSVTANTTSVMTELHQTGTGTESMRKNIQYMTEYSAITTSIQLDRAIQTSTSSTRWTEDRTSETDDANTSAVQVPLSYSTYQTDVTLTGGSYGTTDKSPAPSLAQTSLEILPTQQTSPNATMNATGTTGHIDVTVALPSSTQASRGFTENTEEPLVSTTNTMESKMQNTEAVMTPPGNVHDNTTNTTWRAGTWFTNTSTSQTETPTGTSQTGEPLVSSTRTMDWKMQENLEDLMTTRGTVNENTTNITWISVGWTINTRDTWSNNSTMSKNISTSEIETPHWTTCFNENSSSSSSSPSRRSSNLLCFITLWTLGMTASIFLGLSVFLWVRLSITRTKTRLRDGTGQRDRKGHGAAVMEKASLWAAPNASAEERVEFWYANETTVEEDRRRKTARRGRTRDSREDDMDMWIQPKVTVKDITEFWYANGRVRQDEETPCEL